jgi:hypothetical protein
MLSNVRSFIDIVTTLHETPHYADLQGRDGLPCRVWKNPSKQEFGTAIRLSSDSSTEGLRGILTATDLYVWQSVNLLHADFERETGIQGVKLALRAGVIRVNDETVALPEHFGWIFPSSVQADQLDMDDRWSLVAMWLDTNRRLSRIYPQGFTIEGYQ